MKIVDGKISLDDLKQMAEEFSGEYVKAVVDVEREIMAIDAELHSDEESLLIEDGSQQQNLWGINIYPKKPRKEWIEFDSMINIRPKQNNRSREVENPETRSKITEILDKLII